MQDACHENDCCFFGCFQGLKGWFGVCLGFQLRFGNGSGGPVVTGVAGQRPLATALCGQSYRSFDWAVFLCSANFVRTAGEPNEMAGRMSVCGARQGCTALLSGNIGEKCSVGDFFFGAHGAPYRRWSRVAGGCCLFASRFRNRMGYEAGYRGRHRPHGRLLPQGTCVGAGFEDALYGAIARRTGLLQRTRDILL